MEPVLILHGPNLNLLGSRQVDIYGINTLVEINARLISRGEELDLEVHCFQSNHEGVLIDKLQGARDLFKGVVFNPGGYTHTSVSIRDAIAALSIPVVEVHLSNIYAREEFRHHSLLSPVCAGTITGFGWRSYEMGLIALSLIILG